MRPFRKLKESTALSSRAFSGLTFDQLRERLGQPGNDNAPPDPGRAGPLSQPSFLDAVRQGLIDAEKARRQLETLREESKRERGFLSKYFNIAGSEKPLDKVIGDVAQFDEYCRKNGISFDEVAQQLVPGEKPKTPWDKIKDFRFLIAAVGGVAAGVAGLDPATLPVLDKIPGLFFTALPYFAVPFIGLNTFKAFSERKLSEEAGTLARFTLTMATGVLIGFGVSAAMGGHLGTLNVGDAVQEVQKTMADGGAILNGLDHALKTVIGVAQKASPGQILMPVIGAAMGLSMAYKFAKNRVKDGVDSLSNSFNKAVVSGGDVLKRWTSALDKPFMNFINHGAVPAIFLLLAATMNQGGGFAAKFSQYSGYYGAVTMALAGCAAAVAAGAYAYGARAKEFKEIGKNFYRAFMLSSSSGTMPYTKETMKKVGVRESIAHEVAPLGATFNMMGTALYLGMTAVCVASMLGQDPTMGQRLAILGTSIATAFGAPGIPASSIAFMTPVLQQLSLTPEQMQAAFAMILLMDRPFDMAQTALNVSGDVVVAMDAEASEKGRGIGGLCKRAWNAVFHRDRQKNAAPAAPEESAPAGDSPPEQPPAPPPP